jgi:hypothetical protein
VKPLRVLGWAGLLLVVAVFVARASAQSLETDLVILQSGGRFRGTVTEYEPGVRVVIQLADGNTRTFVGSEVASVSFAGAPTPTPPPPPSIPGPPPDADPPALPDLPPAPSTSLSPGPGSPGVPVTAPSTAERWTVPRRYDAARQPWENDALARGRRLPAGPVHFGVQLEAGFMGIVSSSIVPRGMVGALAFLEGPMGVDGVVRFGIAVGYGIGDGIDQTNGSEASLGIVHLASWRGLGIAGRLLFGVDLTPEAFLRGGFDLGAAVGPGGTPFVEALARMEAGARLLPDHNLELGAALSGGITAREELRQYPAGLIGPEAESHYTDGFSFVFPRIDVFAAWVFP